MWVYFSVVIMVLSPVSIPFESSMLDAFAYISAGSGNLVVVVGGISLNFRANIFFIYPLP